MGGFRQRCIILTHEVWSPCKVRGFHTPYADAPVSIRRGQISDVSMEGLISLKDVSQVQAGIAGRTPLLLQ